MTTTTHLVSMTWKVLCSSLSKLSKLQGVATVTLFIVWVGAVTSMTTETVL